MSAHKIAAPFLNVLFRDPGFIEVRLIVERKGGRLIERAWFPTPDALIEALPALMSKAERAGAGVFYGVLPRRTHGGGKVADVAPGRVVWADVDFKDFEGGEAEARAKLGAFPTPPSIVVRSAHGLHAYWLIDATAEPAALSEAAKAVAEAIGGDHTHDAARLLRVPGTFNRKDPANPILVEVETFEPERRTTLAALLPTAADPAPAAGLSARVRELIQRNRKVRDAYHGVGKPDVGKDGKPLDTSSSGYDFTLACELARAGVTDVGEIAAALTFRPDGHARTKGAAYARRTAERGAASLKESGGPQADFVVDAFRKFDSRPARYEAEIEGRVITFTTPELLKHGYWVIALTDALGRIPVLPEKDDFDAFVNGLLARAEVVAMPPEASDAEALREAIHTYVEAMPSDVDPTTLADGAAVELTDGAHAGCKAFKLNAMVDSLRDRFPLSRQDFTAALKAMGAVDLQLPGGRRQRVWVLPSVRAREEGGAS